MDWTIHPYRGLNNLAFGMTAQEVTGLIGPPLKVRNLPSGVVRERRTMSTPIIEYEDGRIVAFECPPEVSVFFEDYNVFDNDEVFTINHFKSVSTKALTDNDGGYYFFDIGIVLGDFGTGFDRGRSILIFSNDYFPVDFIDGLEPIPQS